MNADLHKVRVLNSLAGIAGALVVSLAAAGCGSSEQTQQEDWEHVPTVSPNAQLEYRVDSLQNENRRMKEQVNAMAAENRSLTAKNAELETKLSEALAPTKSAPATTTEARSEKAPSDLNAGYMDALKTFRKRDFSGAIQQFEALIDASISNDLADNCRYWIGESYYGLKKYGEAIKNFKQVLDYKNSDKSDDAQLMIGNSYLSMGDKASAKKAYETFLSTYPTSPLVKKAKAKLAVVTK